MEAGSPAPGQWMVQRVVVLPDINTQKPVQIEPDSSSTVSFHTRELSVMITVPCTLFKFPHFDLPLVHPFIFKGPVCK